MSPCCQVKTFAAFYLQLSTANKSLSYFFSCYLVEEKKNPGVECTYLLAMGCNPATPLAVLANGLCVVFEVSSFFFLSAICLFAGDSFCQAGNCWTATTANFGNLIPSQSMHSLKGLGIRFVDPFVSMGLVIAWFIKEKSLSLCKLAWSVWHKNLELAIYPFTGGSHWRKLVKK